MAKGFGLLGLIIVVISTQLTVGLNLMIGFLGLFFVTIGALGGDKMYSIAAVGTFITALLFLSPLTLTLVLGGGLLLGWFIELPPFVTIGSVFFFSCLPIIAMIIHALGKHVFTKPSPHGPPPPAPDLTQVRQDDRPPSTIP